jgi:hypothetical protein
VALSHVEGVEEVGPVSRHGPERTIQAGFWELRLSDGILIVAYVTLC